MDELESKKVVKEQPKEQIKHKKKFNQIFDLKKKGGKKDIKIKVNY